MRIGELAEAAGTTAKNVRYYESEGLLRPPPRTESGYRSYSAVDVERLGFIRKAKRLGLSLKEIRGILQLHDRREPTCVHVRSLLDVKLTQVEAALSDLRDFRDELKRLRDAAGALEDCRPTGGVFCGIIEADTSARGEATLDWVERRQFGKPSRQEGSGGP